MEASVEFLLGNLKQLVSYHVDLIYGAEEELEQLNEELGDLKAILKDASRKLKKDETFKQWERKVREVVYDVEDVVDTCITKTAANNNASRTRQFFRLFQGTHISLAEAVRKIRIDKVTPLLKKTTDEFANLPDVHVPDTSVVEAREIRKKKTQNIVGFEEEANDFINFLNGESSKLGVASIVGMAGLGKTTLAWKIFEDERIKYEFPIKIWANISDNLNTKELLLTILKKFTANPPDEGYEELKEKVKDKLKDGKFLIVVDDIWTSDAWDKIKEILPWDNKMGRVLVTTRQNDVATHASTTKTPHYLRFLTPTESWELLQYQVYGELNIVPPELVSVGKVIATVCDGLPLSIVVIGGILVEKKSSMGDNVLAIKSEWEDVSTSVKPYLVGGDRKQLLANIISLSYEKLPYELRNCFLYLGVFPEDADIPVNKLIRLWIAEGFVQESSGKSLERVALDSLKELINRNLVMVRKAKPDGEPKICHIHDSIREICKTESKYENLNLFQEISRSVQGGFEPRENVKKCRRLCIHSYALDFFSEKPKLPKARSFLCFAKSAMNLATTDMLPVTDGFGLLRVYEAKNLKFPKFPLKILHLLHLRYLTLAVASDQFKTILPDSISDLWNLQTLMVDTPSRLLEMKADIWKMRQLRYIKTKASITLKNDGKGQGGENLQTLSRLSPESCTDEVFTKARNLITLVVKGDLNILEDSKCLGKLEHLNKLKLVYEVSHPYVASERPLKNLPDSKRFPTNLKILVVSGTYLDWKKMSTLSMLLSLEVLKLKENAFKGILWEAVGGGFLHLVRLHIERAELVSWTAKGDPFPELRFLYIHNCEKLLEVPSVIGKKLEFLCMERVTQEAVHSAEAIEKEKKEQGKVFKLELAPADQNRKP